jgi:threonine/homoserine/homoserine lactone efflux protein
MRTSLARSRREGFAAALGMGVGAIALAALALLGLHAVIAKVPWLYAALKLLGGAYLLYLAFRLWRGAGETPDVPELAAATNGSGRARSFALALATQLSNPKAAVIYGGIFAALLPPAPPSWMVVALPPAILLIESGWYTIVALTFSADRPRAAYMRSKRWIDRLAGSVIGLLGVRLIVDGARRA